MQAGTGGRGGGGGVGEKDLKEGVWFGVGVISRPGVCGPPHFPGQAGVDFVLIVAHRQLIILCHATQDMQNLRSSSMQPMCQAVPYTIWHQCSRLMYALSC